MKPLNGLARLGPTVAAIWLGMLIGVSLIATPVKFHAAGLDLPTALDIGRLTFGLFARVEWALALCLIATLVAGSAGWRRVAAAVVIAGLALQAVWLLPALTARVAVYAAGAAPEESFHHALYAGIEGVKLIGLFALCLPGRAGECGLRRTSPV